MEHRIIYKLKNGKQIVLIDENQHIQTVHADAKEMAEVHYMTLVSITTVFEP